MLVTPNICASLISKTVAIYNDGLPGITERFVAWIERQADCFSVISCSDNERIVRQNKERSREEGAEAQLQLLIARVYAA